MDKICRVKEMHVVTEIDARTYMDQIAIAWLNGITKQG